MKPNHVISLLQGSYTTVDVRFDLLSKLYTYKTRLSLVKGDWAVVLVKNVLKIVEVISVHSAPKIDYEAPYDYKWIVQKVDMTMYEKTVKEEQKLQTHLDTLDRLHKRQALLEILDKTYPSGSKAHDYWLTKIKPLLED